jgi:hypothetical protein
MELTVLRLIKWVGVALWSSGILGVVLCAGPDDRRRAAHVLATVGLLLSWVGGWAFLQSRGVSMGTPWVLGTMVLSLLGLQVVVLSVESPERPSGLMRTLAVGCWLGTLILMTFRPGFGGGSP